MLTDPYPPNSNSATYLYYDGWNLIQEGPTAWSPSRLYAQGNRVDEIAATFDAGTGQFAYHHYDARGHCTLLTNSGGAILEQYEYDAFGLPYFFNAAGDNIGYSPFGNRFLFTGREWLADLHLYDYRHRMYQPELGRFLQPDPLHFKAGDYNLYRYCHNDPVNMSDPFGLAPIYPREDVDEAARAAAAIVRGLVAGNKKDGMERATSVGRDPNGKVFHSREIEVGKEKGKVGIPTPDRNQTNISPEAAVHAHTRDTEVDPEAVKAGKNIPLRDGERGAIGTFKDRLWADELKRPMYTITPNGKLERYLPDDAGGSGLAEGWNEKAQSWK